MSTEHKPVVRCAVYTRKSSEEGLEQSFNSLDAQREACQAFILSQRQEGWKALPDRYDDGGYSGGNLQRPALQRLLEDIEAHKVDTIVVYKVDRLTRSLADFAKIVEALDARGVSFVSVTQQFNKMRNCGDFSAIFRGKPQRFSAVETCWRRTQSRANLSLPEIPANREKYSEFL